MVHGAGLEAADVVTQKLTGRWLQPPNFYGLGSGGGATVVAASDRWIAVGAPLASERVAQEGAVQVFNAVSGAWVKELLQPGAPSVDGAFGASCALSGNLLLIGQKGSLVGDPGAAHLYSLPSGKLVKSLHPPVGDDVADNGFGNAVAIAGNFIFVGAPRLAARSGAVFVFDLKTGGFVAKIVPAGNTTNSFFGVAIAAEGNLVAFGASGSDSNQGAAYLYDLASLTLIKKVQPTGSTTGEFAGSSLAMHHGRLVMGATGGNGGAGKIYVVSLAGGNDRVLTASDATTSDNLGVAIALDHHLLAAGSPNKDSQVGAVYLFDLSSPSTHEFRKITAADEQSYFGNALAVQGETVYAAAPHDNSQGTQAGALYMMKSFTAPMALAKVTGRGDYAPGAPDIKFNRIGDALINIDGEISFPSTLSGAGSGRGRDTGVFSTLKAKPLLRLVAKSRMSLGPVIAGVVNKPLINWQGRSVFYATLQGTGVSSVNDAAICWDDGNTVSFVLRKGDPFGIGGSPPFKSFYQFVHSRAADRVGISYAVKTEPGGATLSSDTGVVILGAGGTDQAREGESTTVVGDVYGQFAPRVASYFDRLTYVAAIVGPVARNQALFQMKFQNSKAEIAHKGDGAVGANGAPFASFVGESSDVFDTVLFRATLGSPASSYDREGLWTHTTAGVKSLVMRQGDAIPALPGVKIGSFLRFWQVLSQSMALVRLKGTGVSAANDQALVLYQPGAPFNGQIVVLMREGEIASGCGPATIGTINRVEVEPLFGHYLVLATLKGAPASTNLALYRGFSFRSASTISEQTLRRPFLVLRKGQLFDNQPGKLRSVTLPTTNVTAAGAGSVGLGSAMQEPSGTAAPAQMVLAVDFDNGVHQLMQGTP
jgi:hypothetical protein